MYLLMRDVVQIEVRAMETRDRIIVLLWREIDIEIGVREGKRCGYVHYSANKRKKTSTYTKTFNSSQIKVGETILRV